jgi:hypothetical protein
MEDDWITNFFDKCRLISDEQMQTIWAKILAGEANAPGKFSKRTVNLLASLDKLDAVLFSNLCSFVFVIAGGPSPLVFNSNDKIYTEVGLYFSNLSHLENAGLIHFASVSSYLRTGLVQKGFVHYFGRPVWTEFPNQKENNTLNIGHVMLTKPGEELVPLCAAQPREGFLEYVKEQWKRFGIKTEEPTPESAASVS